MKNLQSNNMGLSIVTRLQQEYFFSKTRSMYVAKVVSNSIMFYPVTINKNKERQVTEKQLEALTRKKFNGQLSAKSQQKIIQICQNWDDTLNYINTQNRQKGRKERKQIILLTLTLSDKQKHDDNWIKRNMLNRFLIKIVREKPDTKYLWKAERQENGNIHFHILLDNYFSKSNIQVWWNLIQRDNQYHRSQLINESFLGSPSTRIESLKSVNNSIAYIAKYMQKNDEKKPISGRLWGCSSELRKLKNITYNITKDEIKTMANELITTVDNYFCNEYCLIINKVRDIADIKNHLYNMAPIVQYTFEHNVTALKTTALSPEIAIEGSDWFQELARNVGPIDASYAYNNELLFPF